MRAAARTPLRRPGRRAWTRPGARRSRCSRAFIHGLPALLALLAILGARGLHTELKESDPAEDAVLTESPAAIALTYTTDVQLTLSSVEVRPAAPDAAPVPAGRLAYLADDRRDVIVLPLSEPLGGGSYTVAWTTAGPDGHKLSGDFAFTVDASAVDEAAASAETETANADSAAAPGTVEASRPGGPQAADGARSGAGRAEPVFEPLRTAMGFLFYIAIVGILGGVVFRWLVLGRCVRSGAPRAWIESATSETALFMAVPLGFLALTAYRRLWDRAETFFPDDVAGNLLTVATGSPWAMGWWLHLAVVVLVAWGILFRKDDRVRAIGWKAATMGALLLPVVPVLSGHGWADSPRALSAIATYLHVAAAGGWMGGLACLLFVSARAGHERARESTAPPNTPTLAEMVAAFSRVAQAAVAVLLVTGALKVWIHVDAASDLWTTSWGRSLLVKDGIVAGVLALGFYNWRFVRPRLERGSNGKALTRSAVAELVLGAAAVAATSFLVAQPLS